MSEPDPEILEEAVLPLALAPARVRMSAALGMALRTRTGDEEALPVRRAGVLVDPWTMAGHLPVPEPALGVRASTYATVGAHDYSDQAVDPLVLNTGADARWLPLESTYVAGGNWSSQGGGPLAFTAGPEHAPVLSAGYSYPLGRRVVQRPALTFEGGAWMQLQNLGWAAAGATVALAAVLRPGTGAGYALISSAPSEDPEVELVYSHGRLEVLHGGTQLVSLEVMGASVRPVVVMLSLGGVGRVAVYGRQTLNRSFSTAGRRMVDLDVYLGRGAQGWDADSTAVMDVLEVDLFTRALDWAEMETLAAALDSAYGIGS
jgi:hypothetical protein